MDYGWTKNMAHVNLLTRMENSGRSLQATPRICLFKSEAVMSFHHFSSIINSFPYLIGTVMNSLCGIIPFTFWEAERLSTWIHYLKCRPSTFQPGHGQISRLRILTQWTSFRDQGNAWVVPSWEKVNSVSLSCHRKS